MKKFSILLLAGILFFSAYALADRKRSISRNSLPAPAQQFLKKHFAKVKTTFVQQEMEVGDTDYEVLLEDGTQIEFGRKGQIKKVENKAGIPVSVLPQRIASTIAERFHGQSVVQIDFDRRSIEVEMASGIEIEFDKQGRMVSFD